MISDLYHGAPGKQPEPFAGKGLGSSEILDVLARFLDLTILQVRKLVFDIVEVDKSCRRLSEKYFCRWFVSFTLDDG